MEASEVFRNSTAMETGRGAVVAKKRYLNCSCTVMRPSAVMRVFFPGGPKELSQMSCDLSPGPTVIQKTFWERM